MCYMPIYPCQAKHPNFLFASAASPTPDELVYGLSRGNVTEDILNNCSEFED